MFKKNKSKLVKAFVTVIIIWAAKKKFEYQSNIKERLLRKLSIKVNVFV